MNGGTGQEGGDRGRAHRKRCCSPSCKTPRLSPPFPPPTQSSRTIIKTKPRIERNRVLVTGGAGFVGSHLCTALVARGDHVICLDNFFTGSKDNIAHLLDKPNFELIRHDVVEKILLEVDQVYHLACPASPVHYKYNPIKTIKTSFIGAMNMLGLAKVSGWWEGGEGVVEENRKRTTTLTTALLSLPSFHSAPEPASCSPPRPKCMATPWSTPRPRLTGATSTRLASGRAMMRASARRRR